jgi:hypothetical protein
MSMTDQVISHYAILEKLGEGGMSRISPQPDVVRGRKFTDLPPYGFRSERDSKSGIAAGGRNML